MQCAFNLQLFYMQAPRQSDYLIGQFMLGWFLKNCETFGTFYPNFTVRPFWSQIFESKKAFGKGLRGVTVHTYLWEGSFTVNPPPLQMWLWGVYSSRISETTYVEKVSRGTQTKLQPTILTFCWFSLWHIENEFWESIGSNEMHYLSMNGLQFGV